MLKKKKVFFNITIITLILSILLWIVIESLHYSQNHTIIKISNQNYTYRDIYPFMRIYKKYNFSKRKTLQYIINKYILITEGNKIGIKINEIIISEYLKKIYNLKKTQGLNENILYKTLQYYNINEEQLKRIIKKQITVEILLKSFLDVIKTYNPVYTTIFQHKIKEFNLEILQIPFTTFHNNKKIQIHKLYNKKIFYHKSIIKYSIINKKSITYLQHLYLNKKHRNQKYLLLRDKIKNSQSHNIFNNKCINKIIIITNKLIGSNHNHIDISKIFKLNTHKTTVKESIISNIEPYNNTFNKSKDPSIHRISNQAYCLIQVEKFKKSRNNNFIQSLKILKKGIIKKQISSNIKKISFKITNNTMFVQGNKKIINLDHIKKLNHKNIDNINKGIPSKYMESIIKVKKDSITMCFIDYNNYCINVSLVKNIKRKIRGCSQFFNIGVSKEIQKIHIQEYLISLRKKYNIFNNI